MTSVVGAILLLVVFARMVWRETDRIDLWAVQQDELLLVASQWETWQAPPVTLVDAVGLMSAIDEFNYARWSTSRRGPRRVTMRLPERQRAQWTKSSKS